MIDDIEITVANALREDIGTGDITAQLIPKDQKVTANIITREQGIIAGIPYVNEVYRQLDGDIAITWHVNDGDNIQPQQILGELSGYARTLLTGERSALNFLQTLSGTATLTYQYVKKLQGSKTRVLDTRKTVPGLRQAQKYAVRCGGGYNHRMGLYDAYLIKENHIAACGSISAAAERAKQLHPDKLLEVEVESLIQLKQALAVNVPHIMLDNFTLTQIKQAVAITTGQAKLEVSGNVSLENITHYAQTGVDYISIGALTKHLHALDLSFRLIE